MTVKMYVSQNALTDHDLLVFSRGKTANCIYQLSDRDWTRDIILHVHLCVSKAGKTKSKTLVAVWPRSDLKSDLGAYYFENVSGGDAGPLLLAYAGAAVASLL